MPSAAEMPTGPAVLERLDTRALVRWAAVARSAFAAHRSEIDSLNVFPVPDGDTGTNLYLTFDAALDRARTALERRAVGEPLNLAILSRQVSRAMLLSARGNSGVILSQLFQGLSQYIAATGADALDGPGLAGALARPTTWRGDASPNRRKAPSCPCRGPRRRRRGQVVAAATRGMPATLFDVAGTALSAARAALARTPTQLPALERAGVVDAGGAGYVLLLEALMRVVAARGQRSGRRPVGPTGRLDHDGCAGRRVPRASPAGGVGEQPRHTRSCTCSRSRTRSG